jgi:hypothetical protein
MHYTVYKTTNNIDGKVYIGCHKTKDINDGYMGSGKYLKRAMEKHGLENFTKEILFNFDNSKEMFDKEKELVTLDFISETNTYNLKMGGMGGWDHENYDSEKQRKKCLKGNERQRWLAENDPEWKKRRAENSSKTFKRLHAEGKIRYDTFTGKTHTAEARKKIGAATSKCQTGSGNSQYGTMCIHNPTLKQNRRIKRTEKLPEGWVKGAKYKW